MNKTLIILVSAGALLLVAVILGRPASTVAPVVQGPVALPPSLPPPLVVPPPIVPPVIVKAAGALSLVGKLSQPTLLQGTSDVFATFDVSAVDVAGSQRAPVNLALVIDRSGSMSGNKIKQARNAALRLVDLLEERDRLSIVHYGNDVRAFSSALATPENKLKMQKYIRGIVDEGGTNIGEGLEAGQLQLAKAQSDFKVNRLILLSDGQPTVGITSPAGLAKLVARIRSTGVSVTSLGVGLDFNEDLMQKLADVGGGSYGFINNAQATAAVFEKDLSQAGTMVARNVNLKLTLPVGVQLREVFGRPASQVGSEVTVTLPDFSAKQIEKVVIHMTVTSNGVAGQSMAIARSTLQYQDLLADRANEEAVSLSALVTNDKELARNSVDKGAYLAVTRAQAATNYKAAADSMERGDFAAAAGSLEKNKALLKDAELVLPSPALAAEKASNDSMSELSAAAPAGDEARRTAVKKMKVQTLQSSGRSEAAVGAY
jgi:Ca-activated chloride channel homolog